MDCGPEILCSDPGAVESSDESTLFSEGAEAMSPVFCANIKGSYDDDFIRIGAVYYWYAPLGIWYT